VVYLPKPVASGKAKVCAFKLSEAIKITEAIKILNVWLHSNVLNFIKTGI
jgi:hypothetical protein